MNKHLKATRVILLVFSVMLPYSRGLCAADAGCFGDVVRISALVNSGGKVRVGIVELSTSNSYFVGTGQRAGAVEVVAIDYDKELVTLKRGDKVCVLALSADPTAPRQPAATVRPAGPPGYRGEAIERFLAEHPEAIEQGAIKFPPVDYPPITSGRGETIDRFLAENPEAARIANAPAVGKGEGIEKFLREHPEVKVDDSPIPEGSLGPGIEAALRNNPVMVTGGIPNAPAATAPLP